MPDPRVLAATLCSRFSEAELSMLREDPFSIIPAIDPEVSIELVLYEPGDGCSVEGLYVESERSILVQQAMSGRRTFFTALHEFGHDRARHDRDVARALAQLPAAASRRAEERVADAFAAAVLIPDLGVDEVLAGSPPTARHLVELFNHPAVAGSREACCVRMAQRMRGEGYVALVQDDLLRFCAPVGGAYRLRRGSSQAEVALVRRAASHGTATAPDVRMRFGDGRPTRTYAGQAVTDDGYTFVVLTDATRPPWGGQWIVPRIPDSEAPEIFCGECDEISEAWQRCEQIPSHRVCSACGWCECKAVRAAVAEKRCERCTQLRRQDLFPDNGAVCRDCL